MRPLHLRVLAAGASRDDVTRLIADLRAAGHLVSMRLDDDDDALPVDFVVSDGAAVPTPETLAAAEARHLRAVLSFTRGNRLQAAALLGVARSTLLAKLRRHGLD
ncbi:MAG TPA: helix-turn-helix domain-containing protein [Gemmatimonadales bacterium]|nr:helix-turn-helix domain-containing protein [Gemmatimonadales bacterium]